MPKDLPEMNRPTKLKTFTLALCLLAAAAASARAQSNPPQPQQATTDAQSSPSQVVRAYYTALRESRFRDAMLMSVLRPAVEALSAEELKEFQTDFARLAAAVPADFEITGESLAGEEATVFVKTGEGKELKVEPVNLIRERGAWVVGDRASANEVRKGGKKFLFEQRIAVHEQEAEDMLRRIQAAQLAYALQNAGRYGDLNALVRAGYVPQDILGTETTGYRFTVQLASDSKSFTARAEPERYGRSGRLSFYLDQSGIQKKDAGGKPLSAPKK